MKITIDVAIFGGGIAGLWLLNRLRQTGVNAILFESNKLGCGQTTYSQGIIHGGMKYALQGVMTGDAMAMADMPSVWQACLQGTGEIDLSKVNILSHHHYLWAGSKLTAKLGGLLAGAALHSRVISLKRNEYPAIFQHEKFKGDVYALNETVLDVPTLVTELAKPYTNYIYKIDALAADDVLLDAHNNLQSITIRSDGRLQQIVPKHAIFTAGEGNELMTTKLNLSTLGAQRRPLHMVLVKTPFQFPLYAHCIGIGARPRMTVTTHYTSDGKTIWYLGGLLAETGIGKTDEEQIAAARKELSAMFRWVDFAGAQFSTLRVNRAEPKQQSGLKPETSFCRTVGNITIGWPTKLALAPKLAAEIMAQMNVTNTENASFLCKREAGEDFLNLSHPATALPPWEQAEWK